MKVKDLLEHGMDRLVEHERGRTTELARAKKLRSDRQQREEERARTLGVPQAEAEGARDDSDRPGRPTAD